MPTELPSPPAKRQTLRQIGWFVALWAGSVLALGMVAFAIRAALRVGG